MEEPVSRLNQDSSAISLGLTRTNAINHDESRATVPHHSLSLSLSDPEAILSSQVNGSVKLSVKDKITVSGAKSDDFESVQLPPSESTQIQTSTEHCGVDSPSSEQEDGEGSAQIVRKSSFLSSIMEVADKHTHKSARPMSAPSRSVSSTLTSQLNGSGEQVQDSKGQSNKQLKQTVSGEVSDRQQNLHVKALSLPGDHKTTSATNSYNRDMRGESVPAKSRDDTESNTVDEKDTLLPFQTQQSRFVVASDQHVDTSKLSIDKATSSASSSIMVNVEEDSRHSAASFSNKQIDSLLETLRSLSANGEVEDLNILEGMIKSNTFKKAKQAHDSMHSLVSGGPSVPKPIIKRVVPTAQHIRQQLRHYSEPSDEVDELRTLLRAPHFQAVLLSHDKVSTRDLYIPDTYFHRAAQDPVDIVLSDSLYNFQALDHPMDGSLPLSRNVPSCRKEDATIVFLEQTSRPLGCTIYKQDESVFVGKWTKGSDSEISDLVREGDEILEINGMPVFGKSNDEVIALMSGDHDVPPGTVLALTIIPVHDDNVDMEYEPRYVKAHFNYNSKHDTEIPCAALGLTFQKGDILEVSNQDDPEWWQARKVFDDGAESLPGLIPSRHLQQQREALIKSYPFATGVRKKSIRSFFSGRKKKKIFYHGLSPNQTFGVGDEVPTYEDVVRFEPNPDIIRPIVLIGAPGVGRRTLIRKLLNSDTSCYHPVIQYTTRPIRPGEINGQDYHFVTREEFECDIEQDRFLEYGELKGSYYGTAFSSIKKIMESHRVPVLELHPQALKKVRHCGLKPYIVFVAPPRLERLHATRKFSTNKVKKRLGSTLQHHHSTSQTLHSEYDLQHLVHESYMIENQYGHYFDWTIINDDFQVAADMLKEVAQRVQEDSQWVPKSWYLDS